MLQVFPFNQDSLSRAAFVNVINAYRDNLQWNKNTQKHQQQPDIVKKQNKKKNNWGYCRLEVENANVFHGFYFTSGFTAQHP